MALSWMICLIGTIILMPVEALYEDQVGIYDWYYLIEFAFHVYILVFKALLILISVHSRVNPFTYPLSVIV